MDLGARSCETCELTFKSKQQYLNISYMIWKKLLENVFDSDDEEADIEAEVSVESEVYV